MHHSPVTKLKQSPRGLPASRSIQKAVLTTSSAETLKRTNAKASTIAATLSATTTSATGGGIGTDNSSSPSLLFPGGSSSSSKKGAGGYLLSSSTSASASTDPLAILKCDKGHARHVTHLHLARRNLSSPLHPNLLLFINVEELWLNDNNLTELRGIAPAPDKHHLAVPTGCLRLKRLFLSRNRLTSFEGSDLSRLPHLEVLLLADNRLSNLEVISQQLSTALVNLKQLELSGNPLAEERNYREYIIAHHPSLEVLDRHVISQSEREKAMAMFPPVQVSLQAKNLLSTNKNVAFGMTTHQNNSRNNTSMRNFFNSNSNSSLAGSSAGDDFSSAEDFSSCSPGGSPSSFRNATATMASFSSNNVTRRNKNKRSNSNNKKNPFMSEMAEVLEVRAKNVRYKRRIEEENKKMKEEREFQECAHIHDNFHKAWNEAVIRSRSAQATPQSDTNNNLENTTTTKGATTRQRQQQEANNLNASTNTISNAENVRTVPITKNLVLPPLKRGVISELFTPTQHKVNPQDPLSVLTMERDSEVFAKCLTEATADEERRKKYRSAKEACLTPSEISAISNTFPAATTTVTTTTGSSSPSSGLATTYSVKDICTKLGEILGLMGSSADRTMVETEMMKHFQQDRQTRHGRLEGGDVVMRVLLEFEKFVTMRIESHYRRSNEIVRSKPDEAVQILRKISTLQDFIKYLKEKCTKLFK